MQPDQASYDSAACALGHASHDSMIRDRFKVKDEIDMNEEPTEIRIALAKFEGWQFHKLEGIWPDHYTVTGPLGYERSQVQLDDFCPDYLNDLNAVARVEAKLTDSQRMEYIRTLNLIIPRAAIFGKADDKWGREELAEEVFLLVSATAAQRCAALMQVIGERP